MLKADIHYCFKEWSEKDFVRELLQPYINFPSGCRLTVYLGFFIKFSMKEFQFSLAAVSYSGKELYSRVIEVICSF